MDKTGKFVLPSPKFTKLENPATARHFLSPEGIQYLTKEQQPPPMYGPRGSTVPPKFHNQQKQPPISNEVQRRKYFCEPCESEFINSNDYKTHKSEHVRCEIDECKFRGHPEFMDTHIAQQHATGLYEQLKKLSTPEEIAQWRADRKKNYPTVASVEQKWKAREQRMARGEKLELERKNRFGRKSDRRQMKGEQATASADVGDKHEKNKKKQNKNKNRKQRNKKFEKKKEQEIPKEALNEEVPVEVEEETICRGVKMFKGTSKMEDYIKVKKEEDKNILSSLLGMYGSDSEDDGEMQSNEEQVEKDKEDQGNIELKNHMETVEVTLQNSHKDDEFLKNVDKPQTHMLCTIPTTTEGMSHEESSESKKKENSQEVDSDDEGPEEASISKTTIIPDKPPTERPQKRTKATSETNLEKPTETNPSDDEGPEEEVILKSTNIPDKPESEPPRKKTKSDSPKRKSLLDYRKLRVGRQNTMLEKLLEADIRHERNVLLQCVRFVVSNNFFDKPKST